ncbi:MAG TPA: helix-turn-helix domain-containing protein [Humisphaera sp.]|nr:helix-turn-helix domain-containing protein [Humisphaera sp.]
MKARSESPKTVGRAGRMTAKGREIVASLTEAIEVERAGIPLESRFTVRTVIVPNDPKTYDADAVRATREKIGVSQPIFAQLLGVSATLVRAWEQGQRVPAPWARRLLDEVNGNPRHWREMLRKAS